MRYVKIFFSGVIVLLLTATSSFAQGRRELTLGESIQIALKKSKSLAVAQEKVREAQAGVRQARSNFFPQLEVNASYTRLDIVPYISFTKFPMSFPGIEMPSKIEIGDDDNYNAVLSVRQPIFTGFKIVNGYKLAEYNAEAQEFDYQKTKAELILNVEKAYYDVLKAEEFVKVSQQAVEQMQAHVRDLENMYAVGMVAKNDLLKAKVQLSNTEVMRIQAENGLKLANVALCSILGISLDTQISPVTKLEYQPSAPLNLQREIAEALEKRPEMTAMNYTVKAAQKVTAIAKSQWLPNIFLVGNYNYKRPNREYEKKFYRSWDVSVAVQWNLFDWGSTYYQTVEAQHRLQQVLKGREQLRDTITLEVTQSYLTLIEAQQKIRATEQNVAQAEENYRVTNEKFKQGMATNTDLLDAQTMLTQAKVDHISALADYNIAKAKLQKSVGLL